MLTTSPAALRAALTRMTLIAVALVAMVSLTTSAAQARTADRCANRLCTKDRPKTPSCWNVGGKSHISRCFIRRAARHFHQSRNLAFYIAHRESRYDWRATNRSSGAAGLYQFMRGTWESTPYHRHSPYHPKWASLAAMWMWKHGGYSHWRCC